MSSIKLLSNEVAFGMGATVQVQFYVGKTPTAPTSAKITLNDPNGTTIIDDQVMTIDGTLLKYVLTADNLSIKSENYRIYIEYIYAGITYPANFLLDVVLTPLALSINDLDLQERHPNLETDLWTGQTNYSKQIDLAFDEVKTAIKHKGNRPDMIIDCKQIEKVIEYKAMELIFFDFSTSDEGVNWAKYKAYKEKYDIALNNLNIQYDANRDGIIEQAKTFNTIKLLR